jgi:hypothetical protein
MTLAELDALIADTPADALERGTARLLGDLRADD